MDLRRRSRIERSDEDLVFELINEHLAPVLRAASDTAIQDTAALAIQELLKLTGCHAITSTQRDSVGRGGRLPSLRKSGVSTSGSLEVKAAAATTGSGSDAGGERLWQRFSDDVKEIITPCLTSKYLLKNSGAIMPTGPLFSRGMSFRRWMYLWIRRLVSQATGRRAEIFTACRGVVRHDMGTALYLLPYLVLSVVCDGSEEARQGVTDEILTVLTEALSPGTLSFLHLHFISLVIFQHTLYCSALTLLFRSSSHPSILFYLENMVIRTQPRERDGQVKKCTFVECGQRKGYRILHGTGLVHVR